MLLDLMLRLPQRATWPLVALTGLCACDSDRVGPSSQQLQSLIATHCERVQTCGCELTLTAETCDDDLTDRWNERVRKGDARGLQYDAECFTTLVDDLDRAQCYTAGGSTPLCERFCAVFHGDVALDEPCEAVDELVSDCAQGLLCHEGTCVEPCTVLGGRQAGERCAVPSLGFGAFDDCAQGLVCSWATGLCTPLATEGQNCATTQCAEDLYCSWQTDTCVRAATLGQSCDESECAQGLYCQWFNGQSRCQAYATEGQSCLSARCDEGLYCSDSNLCSAPPLVGQPCAFGSLCDEGLLCDFDSGRCFEPPLLGQPCLQGECEVGAWCLTSADDPGGTCVEPVEVGEMCSGHRQCTSGFCPNGFCWARPGEGEDCEGTEICAAGLVCNGITCEPTLTRAPAACGYPGW